MEAPRRGLGTDFGDPKEIAHALNTNIYYVFYDFRKPRFFRGEAFGVVGIVSREGVFRVLRVHGPPRRVRSLFFWGPGGSLGAAEVRTMTIYDYNPALVLTIPFLTF